MEIKLLKSPEELANIAAMYAANILNKSIEQKGSARIALSVGASQIETLKALVKMDVDWNKVEMFHLDEYVNLSENHPASFRRYLREWFTNHVPLKKAYFINGEGDIKENILQLSNDLKKAPVDVTLVGIAENAHIAFNNPPADFDTKEPYILVNLDEDCKRQLVSEGGFPTVDVVPVQAISMSVYQIMQSDAILSSVPYKIKANAIKLTLENDLTNEIPATMLKFHKNFTLFIDENSGSLVTWINI